MLGGRSVSSLSFPQAHPRLHSSPGPSPQPSPAPPDPRPTRAPFNAQPLNAC